MTTITDDTKLADVLSSKRNLALLASQEIITVGDIQKQNIKSLVGMGIGETTIEEIRGINDVPEEPEPKKMEWEEGQQALYIRSPSPGYSLQISPGDAVTSATRRGTRIIQPIYIVCQGGKGRLTAEMWYGRRHDRDKKLVASALAKNEKWRKEAAAWLQTRKNYGNLFHLLTD